VVIKSFRESFETEEGQAIIIGALMMLILAFGLIVTLNLGTAVQEKIRLQNNSDAAAYSLAVTEAQAFNYIAFTNRVQAAHYNMIMTVQTYQSMLLLIESVLGSLADVFWTLYGIFFWVPYLGYFLQILGMIFGGLMTGIKYILYGTPNDEPKSYGLMPFMGYAKQAVWYINYAHYIASLVVAGAVWFKIGKNMSSLITTNDSRIKTDYGIYKIANAVLNGYEYFQTFDKYAGGVPPLPTNLFSNSIRKNARNSNGDYENPYKRGDEARFRQKIMGDISNASRSSYFNSSRDNSKKFLGFITLKTIGVTKLLGVSPRIIDNANNGGESLQEVFYNMSDTDGGSSFENGIIPEMRWKREARSAGSWGDIVASDQGFSLGIKLGIDIPVLGFLGIKHEWGQGVYMWSDNNGGNYWRWRTPDTNNTGVCLASNNSCMTRQRDDMYNVTKAYIRIPIRIWDFFGPLKGFIKQVRKGLLTAYVHGCKLNMHAVSGKNWTSDFGPKTSGWKGFSCRKKGKCKWYAPWGCCGPGFSGFACVIEGATKRRFQTHEYVSHEKNAQQYYYGISPYIKFLPKSERLKDFNQPSTWMLMNLPAKDGGKGFLEGKPWSFKQDNDILGTRNNGGQENLSTDPVMADGKVFSKSKVFNLLDPGLNVMSRARVYYHRPNNWNEHPNFFNPYWRAQLAPIAPKLSSLLTRTLGLGNEIENNTGGFFSGLSNLTGKLNQMFSGALARVITH